MRLDKFICKSTKLTKQQVITAIESGEITVNEQVIKSVATQVHENNVIKHQNQVLTARPFRYLLLHKPANFICSNVDDVYPSVLNLLNYSSKNRNDQVVQNLELVSELHIAGRLDADTTGLILITDDGRWTFNITSPNNGCKKVYRVGLSRQINQEVIKRFEQGIQLQGENNLTLPACLEMISDTEVLLTITEGKFHQVKRMFAAVGNRVLSLHREQIGAIKLDVEVGDWRYLTEHEILSFHKQSNIS
ncbi:pseudouridine synthase [Psychromonas sp. SR45-3]|uniref:pseudouridine synthase n=1 Tax=Psychromonas sp. SR45-3 TaxID=2760930 RepID=UPI0015F9C987|nr:pseudouridine synthase [Psychromonas sp. SR45-3]MBB1274858.1 pseudouridine synthase [Psychromonas sp. SR45-3]